MRSITAAILMTSALLAAGALVARAAAAPTTQRSLPPNYESVIQFDRPSLHLRFGDTMPGAGGPAAPNFGTAAVVSGAKATSEAVSLVDEYTIEWWQLVQDVESPHTVVRIGAQDFGLLPVPRAADANPNDPPKATFGAGNAKGGGDIRSRTFAEPGKWYHIAVIGYRNNKTQFFVNGQPDGEPIARSARLAGELTLGSDISGKQFNGEVTIYDRPLSADRIQAHYQTAMGTAAAPTTPAPRP